VKKNNKAYGLRRKWLEWEKRTYGTINAPNTDPILKEASELLYEFADLVDKFYYVCGCPKCGEEYWCRDVGEYCPNCGINIPETYQLNWNIWSADSIEGWVEHVYDAYERRGDHPLLPKGSLEERLRIERRGYIDMLDSIDKAHPRYKEIEKEFNAKIANVENKLQELVQ